MGMTDINNAAGAQNALTARMNAFLDTIDADIGARQAAYSALSANLIDIVSEQMFFIATVDPNDPAPNEIAGGVFSSLASAINAAPSGALVLLYLLAGEVYPVGGHIYLRERGVILRKTGTGSNPLLAPTAYVSGEQNSFYGFHSSMSSSLVVEEVDIALPAKLDAALSWGIRRTLMVYSDARVQKLILRSCSVTGADGQGLTVATQGSLVELLLDEVSFDGDFYGVVAAASGVALISKSAITLTNGAALTDGGTIAGNVVQNA